MGITDWIQDRLFGGNHGAPTLPGGVRPAGGQGPQSPLAQQQQGGYQPSSGVGQAPAMSTGQQMGQMFLSRGPSSPMESFSQAPGSAIHRSDAGGSAGAAPADGQGQGGHWYTNPNILQAGVQTLGGLASAYSQHKDSAAGQQLEREKFAYEQKLHDEETARKQALAAYLNPMLTRMMGQSPVSTQAPTYGPPNAQGRG